MKILSSIVFAESMFVQGKFKESLSFYEKAYEIAIQRNMTLWIIGPILGMAINRKKLGMKIDYEDVKLKIDKYYKKGNWYQYEYDYLQYQLFEEDKLLNLAYERLHNITNKLNEKDRNKFLNCPWPKTIIEEWEKNNEL